MENLNNSSLKTREEVVSDLKNLVELLNDGKEGYKSAADATDNPELKTVFLKLSGERIAYAAELKDHIQTHGGESDNEDGGILGGLHRTWLHIKEALSNKSDVALLDAVITGEKAAIAKYDEYIADYADHADHLELLKEQREGIEAALNKIEALRFQHN
jgi:uncharacterized protein (TIGR02284 family)